MKYKIFAIAILILLIIGVHYATAEDFATTTTTIQNLINNEDFSSTSSIETPFAEEDENYELNSSSTESNLKEETMELVEGEGVVLSFNNEEDVKHNTLPPIASSTDDAAGKVGEARDSEMTNVETSNIPEILDVNTRATELSSPSPDETNATSSPDTLAQEVTPAENRSKTPTESYPETEETPAPLEEIIKNGGAIQGKISVNILECTDKFAAFLIFRAENGWNENYENYKFNKAFECFASSTAILDIPRLESGNYVLLRAEQGEKGAWYNPQILTTFFIP